MAYLNLILRFLRLGPLGLGLIAAAILGLGYYLQLAENDRNALKRAALQDGPPAAVDITAFDRDQHATELREVVVRAQPLFENAYRLTLEGSGSDDYAYMVPLVSPTAADDRVVFGIALYASNAFTFDDITPELTMAGMTGFGNYGPVVEYNGKLSGLGQWDELTEEALAMEGLTMAANSVIVWPYLEGRTAALTPSDTTVFGLLSKIAGAIGLLALAKLAVRPSAPAAPMPAAEAEPVMAQPQMAAIDEVLYAPQEPAPSYTPDPVYTAPPVEDPIVAPRRAFGLRKALIGIVGLAFVALLGSTIYDLVSTSAANSVVEVPTAQERLAATVADVIVPDADPDRHWTDLDVTPVIEWFAAKGMLALAGDGEAQVTLAMIGGGVLLALFMLRWFFTMRSVLRPRTSARFDSMGLN